PTRSISKPPRTTVPSRPAPATRRSTRSTRPAASSAGTVKRRAPSAPFSWARTTSWRCTTRAISYGTSRICWSRRPPRRQRAQGLGPSATPNPYAMVIGALGDIHGAFDTVQDIMARHPEVQLWISVGDVASNNGEYFTPRTPLYWIKGNNEDFD